MIERFIQCTINNKFFSYQAQYASFIAMYKMISLPKVTPKIDKMFDIIISTLPQTCSLIVRT